MGAIFEYNSSEICCRIKKCSIDQLEYRMRSSRPLLSQFQVASFLVILFCVLESIENTVVNHLERYVFIEIDMNFQSVLLCFCICIRYLRNIKFPD